MNYKETLEAIHSIPRRKKEENLVRMERLLELLKDPHKGQKFIHVAGTNGKGSVSRMLEEILSVSGYKTGLFTSPYILDFRERIQINNEMIAQKDVITGFREVMEAARIIEQEGLGSPTEFEVVTAMALLYFKEKNVDIAVIEVGIGGLYDATNVIDPMLSVITSINYDHTSLLGSTLESIAKHKAGIIKGAPAVSSSQQPEVRRVIREKAKEVSSKLTFSSSREIKFIRMEGASQLVRYEMKGGKTLTVSLSLLGIHQMLNAGVVLHAVNELILLGYQKITDEKIKRALLGVRWPGRMEVISEDPLVIVDGAHNLDGAVNLKESMDFYFPGRKVILILGMLSDKDVERVSKVLSLHAKKVILVSPNDFRKMEAETLYDLLQTGAEKTVSASFQEAAEEALAGYEQGDVILAAGSLYTIGDVKSAFEKSLH